MLQREGEYVLVQAGCHSGNQSQTKGCQSAPLSALDSFFHRPPFVPLFGVSEVPLLHGIPTPPSAWVFLNMQVTDG